MQIDDKLIRIYDEVIRRNASEARFHQAVREVLESLAARRRQTPRIHFEYALIRRICEPERQIIFRVPWVDDENNVQINRGFRVQFNSAMGPCKGGLRFHPSVNVGIIKFLGFEQTFKNALTGLPIGGGKGGSDFDPRGRSDGEIMRFAKVFATELHHHLGEYTDVPAGDIGVGAREIGYMFSQYKRLTNRYEAGVLTGKGLFYGGSLARKERPATAMATYFTRAMLEAIGQEFDGKTVVVSVPATSPSTPLKGAGIWRQGHRLFGQLGLYRGRERPRSALKDIRRSAAPIGDYVRLKGEAKGAYFVSTADGSIWDVPCQIAMPSATQNELSAARMRNR